MQGDNVLFNYRGQIAEMALGNRLPAASIQRELAEAGFLKTARALGISVPPTLLARADEVIE